ncbi:hypothetical protein ABDK96_06590 [Citricoccus nitrophenolicus]|uniref:Uncharacterized protein n=1 Tax=Citricoccus nitrophenolicus TaxID=863575 RepID=A0ABV0IGQ4_9MICC|nr:hypothetical protein [Citricoccus sp. I39-566]WMY79285.1 hypothetical protein RE421_05325 [Citricoccus sp. I39-566]
MKRPLKAAAAAVLVSSALFAAPAAAAAAPTSGSVLPATFQPAPKSSTGGMSTMGMGSGSKVFWCEYWGLFC